jgi:hypothetical protein
LKSGSGGGVGAGPSSSSVSSPGVAGHGEDGLGEPLGSGSGSGSGAGAREGVRGRVESRDHYVRSGSGENGSGGQGMNGNGIGCENGGPSSSVTIDGSNPVNDGQEGQQPQPQPSSDGRPRPARIATSPTDASLSSSRSRRLVSGYRFGSGPEDSQSYGTTSEDGQGKIRRDSESTVRRFSVAHNNHNHHHNNANSHASANGVDGSATRGKGKREDDEAGLEETDEERDPPAFPGGLQPIGISSSSNPRRALSNTSTELMEDDHHDDLLSVSLSRASSPPSLRDGFVDDGTHPSYEDALNGVTDGEADADVRAMQATGGGSEGFMRGVEGEEGRYSFPTHRLRRRMKGEFGGETGSVQWAV